MREYLAVLDEAAFGSATPVVPKFISCSDAAARWTGAHGGQAFFAYSDNYLIDLKHAVIVDVEATTAVRQAEVGAARLMLERTQTRFGLHPERLAADTGYGSAEMLAWLVDAQAIAPHIPVFDHSERTDGTFSRADFTYDRETDRYTCPGGNELRQYWQAMGASRARSSDRRGVERWLRRRSTPKLKTRPRCNVTAGRLSWTTTRGTPNKPLRNNWRLLFTEFVGAPERALDLPGHAAVADRIYGRQSMICESVLGSDRQWRSSSASGATALRCHLTRRRH